jgi:hypothetical protein
MGGREALSGVGIWKFFGPGGVDGLPGSVQDPPIPHSHPRPLRHNPKCLPMKDGYPLLSSYSIALSGQL